MKHKEVQDRKFQLEKALINKENRRKITNLFKLKIAKNKSL